MAASNDHERIRVIPVPMFEDNYCYLVIDEETNVCAAVDPAEPEKALAAAAAASITISIVLTTHHHKDHAGGNDYLANAIPGLTIVGGAIDSVASCTMPVNDGDSFSVGSIRVTCLLTPGHTRGHMTYFCVSGPSKHVFTGDVMFVGGCGKFFEGTASEMYPSLYEKIGDLPDDTLLWPGHEYTVSNLTFAARVEPTNIAVQTKLAWAQQRRAEKAFTVPSTVGEEKQHNVFLRCNCLSLRVACSLDGDASPIDCLAALRELKNSGK